VKRYVVGITGASGSVYGKRLVQVLLQAGIDLIITDAGRKVLRHELGWEIEGDFQQQQNAVERYLGKTGPGLVNYYDCNDLMAPVASGSVPVDGMVVVPCTMATAANIAHGRSGNLLERAADVMLKEKRPLVLVPRETPLNQIHLHNLLTLSELGVHLVPAMPGFYQKPQTIADLVDFIVGRVLNLLHIEHSLFQSWEQVIKEEQ